MGFEIPISNDYPDHPKTLQLIAILGPQADVYPLRLWFYASKYRRDGVCKGGPLEVEEACKWRGASGKLSEALISVGLLEVDGKTIHGWPEGIGRAIAIYEAKKQKQREKYARDNGILPEESEQNSPYPGGDRRGDPILERGEPPSPVSPTAKKIVDAYRKLNRTVPVKSCLNHVSESLARGDSPDRLLKLVLENGKRMKIWKICDLAGEAADGKKFTRKESKCPNCGGGGDTPTGPCPGCPEGRAKRRKIHA